MKKPLTLLISATFMIATFVACNRNNDDGYTPETPDPTISVIGVSLNPATASLVVGGEPVTLTATISPANATVQTVTWASSATAIATVENGVVTAVAEGTATITVTTADGDFTATSAITVTPAPIPVESVTLNETTYTLAIGEDFTLIATIYPENATNQNVTWTSSDNAIATIEYGVVTAVSVGYATITVTTDEGNKTATATITVADLGQAVGMGCNHNLPGWGATLGTISWGTTGNTNIETGTTEITGTDGRPNQVWSGAVFASACAKGNTTNNDEFNGGTTGNFNADCRQSLHTFNEGRANAITGDLFSWCAVVRFADQLCPYPWRVPTVEDFRDLDLNLGGTGNTRTGVVNGFSLAEQLQWFTSAEGTTSEPQIGGTWGGARFTGLAGDLTTPWSRYWSQSETSATSGSALNLGATLINPQSSQGKGLGFAVRCVR